MAQVPSVIRWNIQRENARSIRAWASDLAADYEALAGAAIIETDDKRQALQDHDQYVGAAAAMRAMVEKIEGEFSL